MRGSCLSWVSSTSPQPDLLKGLQTLASHRRSQCVLRECELTLLLQASRICEILFCSALWPCLGVLGCLSQDIMPMLRPSEIACFCMCEHLGVQVRRGQAARQRLYGAATKLSGRRHVPPIFTGCPVVSRQPGITSSQLVQTSYDRDDFLLRFCSSAVAMPNKAKHESLKHECRFFRPKLL